MVGHCPLNKPIKRGIKISKFVYFMIAKIKFGLNIQGKKKNKKHF